MIQDDGPKASDALSGLLNAETIQLLAETVGALHHQIPITISELRGTLRSINNESIEANRKLAESNNKNSRSMFWLTVVLAIAAVIQALSAFAQWKVSENTIDVQRQGNATAYAEWQYNMMRNDRLETREVEWRRKDLEYKGISP